jgi:hypothetical protein
MEESRFGLGITVWIHQLAPLQEHQVHMMMGTQWSPGLAVFMDLFNFTISPMDQLTIAKLCLHGIFTQRAVPQKLDLEATRVRTPIGPSVLQIADHEQTSAWRFL